MELSTCCRLSSPLLLLLALAGCEGFVHARGVVTNPAGQPLSGVVVRGGREGEGTSAQSVTGADGGFEVRVFQPMVGTTRTWITADAPGYRVVQRHVPSTDTLHLVLVPDGTPRRSQPDWGPAEWGWRFGLHYGTPLSLSGSVGATWGRYAGWDRYEGLVFGVEPGAGGLKGRAGATVQHGRLGLELAAAALRTQDHPLRVEASQTFAGAEARVFVMPLALTVGGYRRIAGNAPGEGRMLLVSLGLGR